MICVFNHARDLKACGNHKEEGKSQQTDSEGEAERRRPHQQGSDRENDAGDWYQYCKCNIARYCKQILFYVDCAYYYDKFRTEVCKFRRDRGSDVTGDECDSRRCGG